MCGRPSDATGGSVNELQEVEIKIESLQQEIKHLELRAGVSSNDRQVAIHLTNTNTNKNDCTCGIK